MEQTNNYREQWAEILTALEGKGLDFQATFRNGFCPYMQWVRVWAVRKEDRPSIAENGMYVDFKVMLNEGKAEITQYGHIWLTKADQKASYLAMCGAKAATKAVGGKWFTKQSYKSGEDLANRISKFWGNFSECLEKATEGYPYKQMKVNIYC